MGGLDDHAVFNRTELPKIIAKRIRDSGEAYVKGPNEEGNWTTLGKINGFSVGDTYFLKMPDGISNSNVQLNSGTITDEAEVNRRKTYKTVKAHIIDIVNRCVETRCAADVSESLNELEKLLGYDSLKISVTRNNTNTVNVKLLERSSLKHYATIPVRVQKPYSGLLQQLGHYLNKRG